MVYQDLNTLLIDQLYTSSQAELI